MQNRRDWIRRTSLALGAGLVLGDEALALFERLSHRKVFALGHWKREPLLSRYVITRASINGQDMLRVGTWPIVWRGEAAPRMVIDGTRARLEADGETIALLSVEAPIRDYAYGYHEEPLGTNRHAGFSFSSAVQIL